MAERWTVKGRIVVDHVLPELVEAFGPRNGVGGVTVKVSARSRVLTAWGTWNSWGQMKTGPAGRFEVTEEHGNDRRQFKVQLLFDSDRLRIKEGQETSITFGGDGFPIDIDIDLSDKDWHEVHNDNDGAATGGRQAGVIDLGDIVLKRPLVRKHADAWKIYNEVLDLFEEYGDAYRFRGKVVMKYPMGIGNNASNTASYCNPVTGHVYIKENELTSRTLIHELMHKWEFDHCTDDDHMVWQLVKHGTTHQTRENTTSVPFLESFADWAAHKLIEQITDKKLLNFVEDYYYRLPDLPLSRAHIGEALAASERRLANVDYTERGWYSLFNILTYPYLDRVDFNRPLSESEDQYAFVALIPEETCPEARLGYSLKDVCSVFLKYPAKGIDGFMGKNDMNFRDFLARAGAVLPGFEAEKIRAVKTYLDPNATKNPCSVTAGSAATGAVRVAT